MSPKVYVRSIGMRKKLSQIGKRRILSPLFTRKGATMSDATRKKLSESLKGRLAWNKGLSYGRQAECSYCGKKIKTAKKNTKRNKNFYCDVSCSRAGSIGRPGLKGEKNPCWKGGITPVNVKIRTAAKYVQWRRDVFKRDHWICQHCGQVGGKLQAHHIKPFAKFKELRFDTLNGITLCWQCHNKGGLHQKKYEMV